MVTISPRTNKAKLTKPDLEAVARSKAFCDMLAAHFTGEIAEKATAACKSLTDLHAEVDKLLNPPKEKQQTIPMDEPAGKKTKAS
jgi:hypothetical protein